MRKITLLFAITASVFFLNATVHFDENFNYADGILAPNWVASGTIGTFTNWQIGGSALTYSNSGGSPALAGQGKAVSASYVTPYGASNYLNFKQTLGSVVSTGTYYVSFLYNPNNQNQTQSNATVLQVTNSGSNTGHTLWVGKALAPNDATHFRFGVTRGSSTAGDVRWSTAEFDHATYKNTTFFIVMKIVLDGSTNTTATIYVNPVVGSIAEPGNAVTTATDNASTSSVRTSISGLQLKVNGSTLTVYKLSNIRVCDTWAEAVAAQSTADPLATPTVGTASSITADGFTANWSAVANAVGYDVKVYLGTNLISTTNVSGQSTESAAITELMSGLTYTYKVIAKGDITNFSDSELSATSADITTLDPYASNAIHTDFGDALTWGAPVETQPASGTYPSSSINGFDLSAAVLYTGTTRGLKGETHTNRIAIDKGSNGGKVTLPTVNSVEQIEIHATAGTAGNGFQLKEFNPTTNTWNAIGDTYVYDANTKNAGTDSIYIISISRSVPTKFRIENPTNGGIYLMQVITRTTNPALLAKPTVGEASGVNSTGFTANWTAVSNASGYKAYVYQGTTLISGAPFTANGQATESLAISNLTPETAYTFKVQAIGDGDVNFSDSFLSAASAPVTTSIGTSLKELNNLNFAIVTGKKISLSETGNINIFNLQGSLVYQAKNVNAVNTNLASGMYIVNFTNASGKKLIQKISIK